MLKFFVSVFAGDGLLAYDPKKNMEKEEKERIAAELRKCFDDLPPKEVQESIDRIYTWIDKGLPVATDGAFLSSAMSW